MKNALTLIVFIAVLALLAATILMSPLADIFGLELQFAAEKVIRPALFVLGFAGGLLWWIGKHAENPTSNHDS